MGEWREGLSGLAGGVAQVLVGHPFDTVKVRMQTGHSTSLLAAIKNGRMYSGVTSPLMGIGLCNAVLFSSYSFSKSITHDASLSGAMAGFCMALVNCPVELLKVRLQTSGTPNGLLYSAIELVKMNGYSALLRGMTITIIRDVPSFAAYFTVYEWMKEYTKGSSLSVIISGASAGIAAWLPCFPQDVIKSVIQSSPNQVSIKQAIHAIYKRNGIMGFFRGFGPTMARAIPANAATFTVYELLMALLSRVNQSHDLLTVQVVDNHQLEKD